ncbi:MAG: hypothetical protein OXG04_23845 [Acidobacteria bacterium]|nr:hypothetical protein [Acidobacteriota bacterium]
MSSVAGPGGRSEGPARYQRLVPQAHANGPNGAPGRMMTEKSKQAAATVPQVVQSSALAPSCSGVLSALPDDIADADVPALLADIERRVEALPGAFDAALARQQVPRSTQWRSRCRRGTCAG